MEEKKEILNEGSYQQTQKKLLKLAKIFLGVAIILPITIIAIGLIKQIIVNNNVEKVDYVAETNAEIEKLEKQLEEEKPKLAEEKENITNKKAELVAKGVKASYNYNDGEAYDLYILNEVLDPARSNDCYRDEYKDNELTKEYCALETSVSKLESEIKTKQDYISSGKAAEETTRKNADLKMRANSGFGLTGFIFGAVPAFMFPGMIALLLFTTAKRRNIMAYHVQGSMPVVQEGMEKMAPTIGKVVGQVAKDVAPAYGEMAKEISKGIKEGLKDDKKESDKKKTSKK